MAEVLGWPARLPLVAPCDRPRVLRSWAAACGGQVPRECSIPLSEVRLLPMQCSAVLRFANPAASKHWHAWAGVLHACWAACPPALLSITCCALMPRPQVRSMSPEAFVELLAAELHVAGVVVGSNYRFGYRAAGTAELLQQLGPQHGMQVCSKGGGCMGWATAGGRGWVSCLRALRKRAQQALFTPQLSVKPALLAQEQPFCSRRSRRGPPCHHHTKEALL